MHPYFRPSLKWLFSIQLASMTYSTAINTERSQNCRNPRKKMSWVRHVEKKGHLMSMGWIQSLILFLDISHWIDLSWPFLFPANSHSFHNRANSYIGTNPDAQRHSFKSNYSNYTLIMNTQQQDNIAVQIGTKGTIGDVWVIGKSRDHVVWIGCIASLLQCLHWVLDLVFTSTCGVRTPLGVSWFTPNYSVRFRV